MRVLWIAFVLLGIVGCGDSGPCANPAGCLRADRIDRACTCVEWETVSTEVVALPFVVTDVTYWPVGTASVFRYGTTWDPSMSPRSASSTGTTVRAVIRRPDGTEQVGRLGTLDSGTAVKSMSATVLGVAWSRALWTLGTDVDLRPSASDWITVWTNPAVTVATNYVGEKTVDWSWRSRCFTPGLPCVGAEQMTFSAALLRGEVTWDAAHEEFLAVIGTNDRAALLAFDARQIAGQTAFPRYQLVADVEVDVVPGAPEVTWRPCVDPADFEVLAETVVPLSGGDSFALQYGVQSDGSCSAQHPGLLVGTTTPGCFSHAQVLVDRLSGTLLMDSSATSVACTRG